MLEYRDTVRVNRDMERKLAAACLVMFACGESNPMPEQAPPSLRANNEALLENKVPAADLPVEATVAATTPAQAPACGDIL